MPVPHETIIRPYIILENYNNNIDMILPGVAVSLIYPPQPIIQ